MKKKQFTVFIQTVLNQRFVISGLWHVFIMHLFFFCQAIINEDTQGNVRQLQAEVKKLKEQLAQALASPGADYGRDVPPGGPALAMGSSTLMLTFTPSK